MVTVTITYRGNVSQSKTDDTVSPRARPNYQGSISQTPSIEDYICHHLVTNVNWIAAGESMLDIQLRGHTISRLCVGRDGATTVTVRSKSVDQALAEHIEIAREFPELLGTTEGSGLLRLEATDVRMPYSDMKLIMTNYARRARKYPMTLHSQMLGSMLGLL